MVWEMMSSSEEICEHQGEHRWREDSEAGQGRKVGAMQSLLAHVAGASSHGGGIFSKRPSQRTSLEVLQRILEHRGKDNETLTVVEMSAEHRKAQQAHMNRHMLLQECHKDVKQFNPHARKLSLSR